ncbi:lipocalin family protein [uncultured Microscilla sp.]|uniref:lipocalin family protein n=1 Tax=uncultured Microscilla sp. TaxID=432653 RepID=UPI002602FF27|nr:lipocalin family protein [uncultured Microscilla sp.]
MKIINTYALLAVLFSSLMVACNTKEKQNLPAPVTNQSEKIEGYVIVLKDKLSRRLSEQSTEKIAQEVIKDYTTKSPKVTVLSDQGKLAFSADISSEELQKINQDDRVEFVEYFKGTKAKFLDFLFNPVQTAKSVDLDRYVGKWYELASFPQDFSSDCECTTANYSPGALRGIIKVFNQCNSTEGSGEARGTAFVMNPGANSRLLLTLQDPLVPVPGLYWILEVREASSDKPYTFAVVSNPFRSSLFILSRKPTLETDEEKAIYQDILNKLKKQKFDLDKLQTTNQENCNL